MVPKPVIATFVSPAAYRHGWWMTAVAPSQRASFPWQRQQPQRTPECFVRFPQAALL